jgi:predicted MPP superfamily phosphohydrolase
MRNILPILFPILFLGIFVGANIYLSKRFSWFFSMDQARPLYILFAFLSVFMIAGLIIFTNTTSPLGSLLYKAAAITTGLMLYILLSVLVVDLLHFVIKVKPVYYGISAISLTLLISGFGLWNATNTRMTNLELPLKGLKSEVEAMHWSDIHIGHFRGKAFVQKLVDKTKASDADMLLITGDLFDGKIRLNAEALEPLKQLDIPIYFVEGNHDGYSGVQKIKKLLREQGVHVLENEVAQLGELQIIGLNHLRADTETRSMHGNLNGKSIKGVLADLNISDQRPSVLLHHSPDGIQYASEKGVDLYLSGHTHAGQLFPINYLNELLFSYNKGLHNYNGTSIFVSQGAGTFGPPMRVGTKSEITLVRLMPQ